MRYRCLSILVLNVIVAGWASAETEAKMEACGQDLRANVLSLEVNGKFTESKRIDDLPEESVLFSICAVVMDDDDAGEVQMYVVMQHKGNGTFYAYRVPSAMAYIYQHALVRNIR